MKNHRHRQVAAVQWGRGGEAAESPSHGGIDRIMTCFNGATVTQAVEARLYIGVPDSVPSQEQKSTFML